MKYFFAIFGGFVAALWITARLWVPPPHPPGVTVLSWSTDPNPARQTQLAPFHLLHPDILVKIEPNTYDKTIVQCSSRVGPDIIEIYSNTDMVGFAEAGILMDLTPYAKDMGFSTDVTYPQLRGNLVVEGRQYRFPCNVGNQVILYNKAKFREAGIAELEDAMEWDDFIERVKPLTVRRKDGQGFEQFALLIGKDYVKDIHLQFGGRFYSEDGTRCTLDSPESIQALEFYYDLMTRYGIVPTPMQAEALSAEGGWGSGEIRWFASGRASAIWGARWMMVQFRRYPELRENLGCVFLPRPKGRQPACYCGTRGSGVNVNSPNRMKALEFMKYLASDEYNRVIALDSDGLPPNAAFASHPENLINPDYPWETPEFHAKFVEAMRYAQSPPVSPFVDPVVVNTIWVDAIDYITNGIKMPEAAMKEAAKRVNDRIDQNVRDREDLRQRYDQLRQAAGSAASGGG
jgi:multiple sugar transport system substrate-binding protein